MRLALQTENLEVPTYLSLLEEELIADKSGTETAVFSMYCFWTGEKEIGKLDGVVETQAGFMNGCEVVAVKYDPEVIQYKNQVSLKLTSPFSDLDNGALDSTVNDKIKSKSHDSKGTGVGIGERYIQSRLEECFHNNFSYQSYSENSQWINIIKFKGEN